MKKKKYYNKRKAFMSQSFGSMFTVLTPKGSLFNRGRHLKTAICMIGYSAGDRRVQKASGFSLRRIKVLRKQMIGTSRKDLTITKCRHFHDEIQVKVDTAMSVKPEYLGNEENKFEWKYEITT